MSRSTLYHHLEAAGVSTNDYTDLTDENLDQVITTIKVEHPNDGEVLMRGHLLRMGIRVTRQQLHNSIHRVDHENTVARGCLAVRRRVYNVPYPNYIWHIDGHHKLIRWRFVIHGGIDGFSRTIMYLKCADNNRAQTVLTLFHEGVTSYGLPNKVRSDHGGENVDVWRYMIANHENDYSCVITGSSVHNERIERLWRDVHRCVASIYADLFRDMEQEQILDPLNESDIYTLHYIFIPRINRSIAEFKESWNLHPLLSEGSLSPYQLFFEGARHNCTDTSNSALNPLPNLDEDRDRVLVPRMNFTPCSSLIRLINTVDPLQASTDNGLVLYRRAIYIVGQHLHSLCNQCQFN